MTLEKLRDAILTYFKPGERLVERSLLDADKAAQIDEIRALLEGHAARHQDRSMARRARQTLPVRSSNIFAGMLLDAMAATHYIDGRYSNYLCGYRSFIGGQPCNAT